MLRKTKQKQTTKKPFWGLYFQDRKRLERSGIGKSFYVKKLYLYSYGVWVKVKQFPAVRKQIS